jgi:hypothetical protein
MNVNNSCLCGRSFVTSGALAKHRHSCKKSKTRLCDALSKAKDIWQHRKKRRIETPEHEINQIVASEDVPNDGETFSGLDIETQVCKNNPRFHLLI